MLLSQADRMDGSGYDGSRDADCDNEQDAERDPAGVGEQGMARAKTLEPTVIGNRCGLGR